jgi:hypothetical protein
MGTLFAVTTDWFRASRFDVNPNVGYLASNLRWPLALDDQQETATFVLDTGHRVDAKNTSSHSTSEMEISLCGTLLQRYR